MKTKLIQQADALLEQCVTSDTVRATKLIGREPTAILRAIARDQVKEMLGER